MATSFPVINICCCSYIAPPISSKLSLSCLLLVILLHPQAQSPRESDLILGQSPTDGTGPNTSKAMTEGWESKVWTSFCCSVMSSSLRPHGLYPARLLCPWDFPGKNTGVGCHFLLQGIFLTQGSNLSLLHWQADSLMPSCQGPSLYSYNSKTSFELGILACLTQRSTVICDKPAVPKPRSKTPGIKWPELC